MFLTQPLHSAWSVLFGHPARHSTAFPLMSLSPIMCRLMKSIRTIHNQAMHCRNCLAKKWRNSLIAYRVYHLLDYNSPILCISMFMNNVRNSGQTPNCVSGICGVTLITEMQHKVYGVVWKRTSQVRKTSSSQPTKPS